LSPPLTPALTSRLHPRLRRRVGFQVFISMETADCLTIYGFARLRIGRHSVLPRWWPRAAARFRNDPRFGVLPEAPPAQAAGSGAATPVRRKPRARKPVADADEEREAERAGLGAAVGAALADDEPTFTELRGAALVRELHVYGQLVKTSAKAKAHTAEQQHTGHGRAMMLRAEWLAAKAGCARVAVISGVGARGYYRKLGYELDGGAGGFMMKELGTAQRAAALVVAAAEAFWGKAPLALLGALLAAALALALALLLRVLG
jgi:GNAT superfamily N-acetyltransferase